MDKPAGYEAALVPSLIPLLIRFMKRLGRGGDEPIHSEYRLMNILRVNGGELSPTVLARRMDMAKPNASALIRKLEAQGFVERVPNPSDRRRALVRMTQAGRKRMAIADRWIEATINRLIDGQGREADRIRSSIRLLYEWLLASTETTPYANP